MFSDHPHSRLPDHAPEPASVRRSGAWYGAAPASAGILEGEASARQWSFVDALVRQKLMIGLVTLGGGLLAFGLTLPQTRLYRAHMSLEFQGVNNNVMNTRDVDPSAVQDNSSQDFINTQARVLESRPLLERVVNKVKRQNLSASHPENQTRLKKALDDLSPITLAHDLQVRPVDGTRLIDVYIQSTDPDVASALADDMASEYVAQDVENRLNATKVTSGWLDNQVADAKARLEASETALQDYARRSSLLFTGAEDGSVSEARLRQIQEEFSRAQADRAAKESVYEELLSENPDDKTASLRDSALADYQMKLGDLNRQLADLTTVYGPENEKVRRVESQITELKKQYGKQHEAALTRVKNDFDTSKRREALLSQAYRSQQGIVVSDASKAVDYNVLKREAETNRSIYEGMLQKVKSYGIASAMQPSNARLVDPAERPLFPYKPNIPMTTLFGMMGGFMLAVIWAAVRDKGVVHVEYPGQTRQLLQVPELGVVPAARIDPWLTRNRSGRLIGDTDQRKSRSGDAIRCLETANWFYKSSLLAESVRSIRTSLLFGQFTPSPQVIVVSSLGPAQGKTSLVSNLAIAMTEIGRRTLMVDADLRCPTLHSLFNCTNETGLTNILTGDQPVDSESLNSFVRSVGIPNLFLLASGGGTSVATSALFHSGRMVDLIAWARASYDIVLVDTPPLMLADARILGPGSDGIILVLRAGEVKLESVSAIEERLTSDGTRVLGTVLNNWDPRSNGYGSYPDRYYKRGYYQPSAK